MRRSSLVKQAVQPSWTSKQQQQQQQQQNVAAVSSATTTSDSDDDDDDDEFIIVDKKRSLSLSATGEALAAVAGAAAVAADKSIDKLLKFVADNDIQMVCDYFCFY